MGEDKGNKMEVMLPPAETAEVLRRLADQIEQGALILGQQEVAVDGKFKFKQSLKAKPGKVSVKFKLEYRQYTWTGQGEAPAEMSEPEGAPSYKRLKKQMAKQFKALKQPLAMGTLPGPELSRTFVEDRRLMCSFPGKGDEYYGEFLAQAEAFAAAVEAGDREAAGGALTALGDMRKACHERFK